MPPVVVLRVKLTVWPVSGLPAPSSTVKVTTEFSEIPLVEPVPARAMVLFELEVNCIEPNVGAATVTVPVAVIDVPRDVEAAVIVSAPTQPAAV